MSCPNVKFQTQLNNPDSTTDGDDCAVICASLAHDFASCGRFRPTAKQIRNLDGVPNSGGLTMVQFKNAITGFKSKYNDLGLKVPTCNIFDDGDWDDFDNKLKNEASTKWLTVFIDYGVWNDLCVEHNKSWSGDREFNGTHAVCARKGRMENEKWVYDEWDPLYDGRKDQPSNKSVPDGKQVIPMWWLREAAEGRAGTGEIEFAVVLKAEPL